ncbi:MAG: D-tyrosyl-tRNA(Tyr) deacylase [Clostridia bacterium]|nr:D-tyrosyl-tRNA(Tyr) deacylase [Clostridia bacterium]
MKALVQKVNYCRLHSEEFSSEIESGLLVTVGASMFDTSFDIKYLAKKIVNLRIFKDENDKCNLSLLDKDGHIMVVSNFTLQARIKSGTRPDFSRAGDSDKAKALYESLIAEFKALGVKRVETGNFKHHMHISCELDGPFNIILESEGRENE